MTNLTFRPSDLEQDLAAYVALLNRIVAEDEPQVAEAAQREELETLRGAGIILNRSIAEAEGDIVGFADTWKIPATPHAPLTLGVHPEWRGRGVGEQLLTRAQQGARSLGATSLLTYARPDDDDARAFFVDNGFISVSGYRKMSVTLTEAPEQPEWTALSVLTYAQVNQPHLYTEASCRGWRDLWGHTTPTEETTAAALDVYPPEGIFLLFSNEEVVGICKALEVEAGNNTFIGVVDAPGIALAYRSEDNYRRLLLEALGWLYGRGQRRVVLESWGELDMALAACESLGFTLDEHELGYALHLNRVEKT